ncbi:MULTISPECIES: DEAD/DEAH box helicase family protein [unclassified Streptomyces]|uniref:DEAD/DEAH box helicase family protein n=1 Tax=unclassified Streptomyces TaxID=2593676 RepID=UPI002DD82951|nr:DEAD/DEAH box helicase family protein [Streptomyces sp. NBC_01766]WSC20894.1 DEAD/DEAH box helicase family protein [Streptomyces sp. NBC_01766]
MSASGAQGNDGRNGKVEQTLREVGWRVCAPHERDLKPDATAVRTPHPELDGVFVYLLHVDRDLSGLVVAGSETTDPYTLLAEADRLAAPLATQYRRRTWQERPLPFRYGTNGHVWRFLNALDAEHLDGTPAADAPAGGARSRYVFAPARPATVARWKRQAVQLPEAPSLRARLRRLPGVHLDPQRQLYDAQRRAVEGLESSLAADRQRALIQMATGAGKTYTVVQASHRLLRHSRAHRVLFLVDRFNLGDQAYREYRDFQPADSKKPLHEEFPLKHLSGARSGLADSDKIVITTIQRLWCMLTGRTPPEPGSEETRNFEGGGTAGLGKALPEVRYSPMLPPDSFDFIVIDECHRSIYGAWRPVLEYFDAHIVGLTATPIGPTFAFFENNLVSQYTYEEAVADEVNVDYDVYRISTRITRDGSKIPAISETQAPDGTVEKINTVVAQVDRVTREQHWHQQEEDDEYTAAELNGRVESTSQIRTVVETFRDRLFTEIFPADADPDTGEILHQRSIVPKTLIFAATNRHADAIVAEVRRAWNAGDRFCLKINSETTNPAKAIRDFRNESEVRIAVTVDMIATGTDIPALECLVFMRDVHTWSYFEQMKGRGARLIKPEDLRRVTEDAVCKDRFVIVDVVGVTEHPMIDARPLVRDDLRELPSLERLLRACAEGASLSVADVSTLAGRLSRLGQRLDEQQLARIEGCTGGRKLTELVTELVHAVDPDHLAKVRGNAGGEVEDGASETGDGVAPATDQAGSARTKEADVDAVLAQALRPFVEREALREALLDAARSRLIKIDHISQDGDLIAEGVTDVMRAERTVKDWRRFMADRRDKFAALSIAFEERRPLGEVQAQIDELLGLVSPPQQRWTGQQLWKTYVDLGIARTKRRRNAGLPELLSVLRCELKLDGGGFRPYRDTVKLRLGEWLARQETAGVTFTEDQRRWLERVANVVATSAAVSVDALDQHAVCRAAGGWSRFRTVFAGGTRTPSELIDELDRKLGA